MENNQVEPITFKLITLGDSNVGKTSLLSRFHNDKFNKHTIGTIGLDSKKKKIKCNGEDVVL